jgi:hypothetical protein
MSHNEPGDHTPAREFGQPIEDLPAHPGRGATPEQEGSGVEDTRDQVMCDTCGWTWGMVCPECIPGCGCNNGRCSGWRHHEYRHDDDDLDDDYGCAECGAGGRGDPYGECVCFEA